MSWRRRGREEVAFWGVASPDFTSQPVGADDSGDLQTDQDGRAGPQAPEDLVGLCSPAVFSASVGWPRGGVRAWGWLGHLERLSRAAGGSFPEQLGRGLASSWPGPAAGLPGGRQLLGAQTQPEDGLRGRTIWQNVRDGPPSSVLCEGSGCPARASGLQPPACAPGSALRGPTLLHGTPKGTGGQRGEVTCLGSPSWALTGWDGDVHLFVLKSVLLPPARDFSPPQRNQLRLGPCPGVSAGTQGSSAPVPQRHRHLQEPWSRCSGGGRPSSWVAPGLRGSRTR